MYESIVVKIYNLADKLKKETFSFLDEYTKLTYKPQSSGIIIINRGNYCWNRLSNKGILEHEKLKKMYLELEMQTKIIESNLPDKVKREFKNSTLKYIILRKSQFTYYKSIIEIKKVLKMNLIRSIKH